MSCSGDDIDNECEAAMALIRAAFEPISVWLGGCSPRQVGLGAGGWRREKLLRDTVLFIKNESGLSKTDVCLRYN